MASFIKDAKGTIVGVRVQYGPRGERKNDRLYTNTPAEARALKLEIESAAAQGRKYVPRSARVTLREYAPMYVGSRQAKEKTRNGMHRNLENHVYSKIIDGKRLGDDLGMHEWTPTIASSWLLTLKHLAPSTQRLIFVQVSGMFNAAAADDVITKNPFKASSVTVPSAQGVKPIKFIWPRHWVQAITHELPPRYKPAAWLGGGAGLRQGEVFGLAKSDVDFLRGVVNVNRQIQIDDHGHAFYSLPKMDKTRSIPLRMPSWLIKELAAYMATFPPLPITLPWHDELGQVVGEQTHELIMTTEQHRGTNKTSFNDHVWRPARDRAKIPAGRDNGTHALRHFFISTMIGNGENPANVSAWAGHSSVAFTLARYTHQSEDDQRPRGSAIDDVFTGPADSGQSEPVSSTTGRLRRPRKLRSV